MKAFLRFNTDALHNHEAREKKLFWILIQEGEEEMLVSHIILFCKSWTERRIENGAEKFFIACEYRSIAFVDEDDFITAKIY